MRDILAGLRSLDSVTGMLLKECRLFKLLGYVCQQLIYKKDGIPMRFNGISIITDHYADMVNFYKKLLQVDVKDEGVIAIFKTKGGKLSICDTSVMRFMAPGCMKGAGNGSYTIEFEVEDADQTYEAIKELGVIVVKELSTQTWGRRSVWIRDPQGNIINIFHKVKKKNS